MMVKKYCIFLTIEADYAIDRFRKLFDPLATKVEPHVTLVHPFETDLTAELLGTHLNRHFKIHAREFWVGDICWEQNHALLPVKHPELAAIRALLYTGILKSFLDLRYPYSPHITIGRYSNEETRLEQKTFSRDFKKLGLFRSLVLEKIHEDESSEVIYSHSIVAGGLDEIS